MITSPITLSATIPEDLPILFHFQLDKEANYLAAFTPTNPTDKPAYLAKYAKLLADPTITMRTIKAAGERVGSVAKFMRENNAEITYWLDRKFWGQGIATVALQKFLEIELSRPLYGRVAFDNYGSQKVLEHCGFVRIGQDRGFATARQNEIEEYIYQLTS